MSAFQGTHQLLGPTSKGVCHTLVVTACLPLPQTGSSTACTPALAANSQVSGHVEGRSNLPMVSAYWQGSYSPPPADTPPWGVFGGCPQTADERRDGQ